MAKNKEEIMREIKNYMENEEGEYSDWYVGISQDAQNRLFNEHQISEEEDLWIIEEAYSVDDARFIEHYFVEMLDTDGGPGGGDEDAVMVYAYKKTYNSNP
jgi:hypothetical protein